MAIYVFKRPTGPAVCGIEGQLDYFTRRLRYNHACRPDRRVRQTFKRGRAYDAYRDSVYGCEPMTRAYANAYAAHQRDRLRLTSISRQLQSDTIRSRSAMTLSDLPNLDRIAAASSVLACRAYPDWESSRSIPLADIVRRPASLRPKKSVPSRCRRSGDRSFQFF
jgi:hypothetical protein